VDSREDTFEGDSEAEEGDGEDIGEGDFRDFFAGVGLVSRATLFRFVASLEDVSVCDEGGVLSASGDGSGGSITGVACIN
jgi:hypothetical protein